MSIEPPRITVLGEIRVDGVNPGGRLPRALVAAVASGPASGMSVPAIGELLWGDALPAHPKAALQSLVSRVRAACGPVIVTTAVGYALSAEYGRSDWDIARAVAQDREDPEARTPERLQNLDAALTLWAGEPGADLGDAPVGLLLAEQAAAVHLEIRMQRALGLRHAGRGRDALDAYRGLLGERPFDEHLHAEAIGAFVAQGDTAEALAVFADLQVRLREVWGASPGPEVVSAHLQALRASEGAVDGSQLDTHTANRTRGALPGPLDGLVGRAADLAALESLLDSHRLVTVLGIGGLGKTSLVQAGAHRVEQGVVMVRLASVRAGADLLGAVASALGVREATTNARLSDVRSDLRALVLAELAERPTLLVLDNCEQIIADVACWVDDVLSQIPTLSVLTTSRAPLGLPGEQVFELAPLRVADDGTGSAEQLFERRARSIRASAAGDVATIARLCRALDGLPLAIELAAARTRTMSISEIEVRLQQRFTLLQGGDRSAPERHQTLRAVIDWSWELLDATSQEALAVLALLPGGWSTATALAVLELSGVAAEDADAALTSLVEQSMLTAYDDVGTRTVRFRMYETVREFGLDRLRESATVARAEHAVTQWARGFVRGSAPQLYGVPGAIGAARHREVRAERDNLVAILRHAIRQNDSETAVLIVCLLGHTDIVRGAHTELQVVCAEAADLVIETARARLRSELDGLPDEPIVLAQLTCIVWLAGIEDVRLPRLVALLRLVMRRVSAVRSVLRGMAAIIAVFPDLERVAAEIARLRAVGDPEGMLAGALFAAMLDENLGEHRRAEESAREAWRDARSSGQVWLESMAANTLAQLASQSARPGDALTWLDRAAAGLHAFDAEDEADERNWLRGLTLLSLGRTGEARALFEGLVDAHPGSRDRHEFAAISWFGLAEVSRAEGDTAESSRRFARAMLAFETPEQRASPWYLVAMSGMLAAACLDGTLTNAERASWANRIRTRVIAMHRVQQGYIDRPILGTALIAWGAWAIEHDELVDHGIEALAWAGVLGARQDQPALRLESHRARAIEVLEARGVDGASRIADAAARAAAAAAEKRVPRALEALAARASRG